jgi:hypothetical protein
MYHMASRTIHLESNVPQVCHNKLLNTKSIWKKHSLALVVFHHRILAMLLPLYYPARHISCATNSDEFGIVGVLADVEVTLTALSLIQCSICHIFYCSLCRRVVSVIPWFVTEEG